MKKITISIMSVVFGLLSWSASAAIPKTLNFATEATYPPFEAIDAHGQIVGFDVDMMNALCKQMDVTCHISNQPFDSLIPSLKVGKFDALIGGLNITPEREKQVDFTDAYYQSTASFATLASKMTQTSPEALKGKIIGAQGGTSLEAFLKAEYPDSKIKTYASQLDAFLDLTSGRVDLVFGDTPMILSWLKTNNTKHEYAIAGHPVFNSTYFGQGYGIAVKQGNTELKDALNKALSQIKANGEYKKIVEAYFPNTETTIANNK